MKQVLVNLYEYSDLDDKAKAKARDWFLTCILEDSWWDCTYEDAKQIGLGLDGFDQDSWGNISYVDGSFAISAVECCNLILANHGAACDTYAAAQRFEAALDALPELPPESAADYGECERRLCESVDALEGDFLRDLLNAYAELLREQYAYICTEAYLVEGIEANEYTFNQKGERFDA